MGMTQDIDSLPLVRTTTVGDLTVHALEAGLQRLDGGAMFGVVPKPLWQRRIEADERNRIPLGLRCLLIETADALVLVDTGIGDKEGPKFTDIYGVENDGSPTRLEDAIREAGHTPEDVDIVVSTHLHFDHAGGNTRRHPDADPEAASSPDAPPVPPVPSFPRARYVVQREELEFAHRENERIRASYMAKNFDPVTAAGLWDRVEGTAEIVPGIRVEKTPGHTPHHQSVFLESAGQTACFLADLVPTTAHLPLPWIMGYDLEPLVTLETKRALLERARDEGWLLIFEHDPVVPWGRLDPEEKRPTLRED